MIFTSSGSISVGSAVGGLTAGSIPFGGAAGVLSQNNSRLYWDNTNYNLIAGGAAVRVVLGQMSSPTDNYAGIRFASGGESVLGTPNSALWGNNASTVMNVPSGTIYFRIGGSTNYASLDTTSFTFNAASSSRVPLTISLAASQSADAFQVKNSGGTALFSIDSGGNTTTPAVSGVSSSVLNFYAGSGYNVARGMVEGRFRIFQPNFLMKTPAQITANQNNYSFTYYEGVVLRLSSDASRNITGLLASGSYGVLDGDFVWIINVGSNDIVIKHEDVNSTAANRFLNSSGADITLSAGQAADLIYDGTTSRWRVYKRN